MIRCTICGAVFDDSLEKCPVCGQGRDFFVPVDDAPSADRRDSGERFVILGGGPAGLAAAEAIRARDATATIALITEEDALPYHRPRLTKTLDAADTALPVHPAAWYADRGIDVQTGRQVVALDAVDKTVTLDGGKRIPYDRCVYALGARGYVPALPGVALPGVTALRGVADVGRIEAMLAAGARRVVIIGGGVLGLEAASALERRGREVVVLERGPRLMPRQLDVEASEWLLDAARAAGIDVLTNAETAAILGTERVLGVRLTDGRELPADMVILSAGVRANTDIAQRAGAAVGLGVRVDDAMRTSLPDVWAAGDCAQIDGPNAQLWPVAAEMGRVAGINAAGGGARYTPVSFAVTFEGMGTILYAEGDVGGDPAKTYRVAGERNAAAGTLTRRYYDADGLCGVILLGDIHEAGAYARRLKRDG